MPSLGQAFAVNLFCIWTGPSELATAQLIVRLSHWNCPLALQLVCASLAHEMMSFSFLTTALDNLSFRHFDQML